MEGTDNADKTMNSTDRVFLESGRVFRLNLSKKGKEHGGYSLFDIRSSLYPVLPLNNKDIKRKKSAEYMKEYRKKQKEKKAFYRLWKRNQVLSFG